MGYANVLRPFGFVPYAPAGKRAGNVVTRPIPPTRTVNTGGNASTDLAIGDAYALDANGNVYRAGPGDTVRGIVIGFTFQANPLIMNGGGPISVDYITGSPPSALSSFPFCLGCEDNSAEFWVQSNSFTIAQQGLPFNLQDAAPDPNYRQSRQIISTSAAGTQFRVMGLVNSPADNAYGAFARVFVRMLQSFQN
jgi:hypothetical protein